MVTAKFFKITFDWARYWFAAIGVTATIYGYVSMLQFFLAAGVTLVAFSVGCTGLSHVAKSFEQPTDDYAATIHRSMVENYFITTTSDTDLSAITPEFVTRTTFTRPDNHSVIRSFYQTTTFVILLVCLSVVVKILGGLPAVIFVSLTLGTIYLTDIIFGLRSLSYFAVKDKIQNPDTTHTQTITKLLSDRLGIKQPDIHYIDSEYLIAGAINPIFFRPQLYLSQNVLEKQQHIQTGIIAHELAHMYADEGQRAFSHRYIQLLLPLSIIGFGVLPLTVISITALWFTITLLAMLIAIQRHNEEFAADELATTLTKTEFVILAILELTPHNPFVDDRSKRLKILSKISNTHPPSGFRIQRLVENETN